jgi:nitroreductase
MHTSDAIRERRSIKRFTDRTPTRDEITALLDAATLAPNHRLTQPWRFYVLGPQARRAYGEALGARKATKIEDAAAGAAVRAKVSGDHAALPCMIVVTVVRAADPQTSEEDFGAVMMAVENLSIEAVALGLGTHIKTGAIMDDPAARAAAGVPGDERIVAVVNVGVPAELPAPRVRRAAAELTTWMP